MRALEFIKENAPPDPNDPKFIRFSELMAKYNMLQGEIDGTNNLIKIHSGASDESKAEIARMRASAVQLAGPNLQAWDNAYKAFSAPNPERNAELAKQFLETATSQPAVKKVGTKPPIKFPTNVKPATKPNDFGQTIKSAGLPALGLEGQVPPMPTEENGQLGDAERLDSLPNGNFKYYGGFGAYVYDKTGKPLTYTTPSFSGLFQQTDLVTGVITLRYMAGPLDLSAKFDKTGKPLDSMQAQVNLGLGSLKFGREDGITNKEFTSAVGATGDELGSMSNKNLYAMGNKDKEATYDRAMTQVNKNIPQVLER